MKYENIFIGDKFGKWTVLNIGSKNGKPIANCVCDCGCFHDVYQCHLKSGKSKSCVICANVTHGMKKSREYKIWRGIKQRCLNETHPHYARYGGRGIEICEEWKNSFIKFFGDMGHAPEGMTIDRIDNDGGYSKENCRWATKKEQQNNASFNVKVYFDGNEYTIKQLSEKLGIKYSTLYSRVKRRGDYLRESA